MFVYSMGSSPPLYKYAGSQINEENTNIGIDKVALLLSTLLRLSKLNSRTEINTDNHKYMYVFVFASVYVRRCSRLDADWDI